MSVTLAPLQIPMMPGPPELLVILLLVVLVFGASKIPKLARSTGQAMGEFQKGRQEAEEELRKMQEGDIGLDSDSETDTLDDTGSTDESETSAETTTDSTTESTSS